MNKHPHILNFLIGSLLLPSIVWAQSYPKLSITETKPATKYYRQYVAPITSAKTYRFQSAAPFTSVAFRASPGTSWIDTYVVIAQDTFQVQSEEHETEGLPYSQSALLVFDQPVQELLLYTGQVKDSITISLFNAQASKVSEPALRQKRFAEDDLLCEKPALVTQEEWRAGLPLPSYQRATTQVNHVIIHHSATSNSLTDYENVVRNIYLFHTRDREWSDIGYNFLVAPDGTLFEGRSAGGQNVDGDNVRGAHFCGRNSGTMGVCLLGNYNSAVPTDTALATIVRVTSWKLDKEGLDPRATNSHPANNNLEVIAGHRNGCATECPGENLYSRLASIRLSVEEQIMKNCQEEPLVFNVYPVPNDGTLMVSLPQPDSSAYLDVIDLQGRTLSPPTVREDADRFSVQTQVLPAGSYILRVTTSEAVLTRKILIE